MKAFLHALYKESTRDDIMGKSAALSYYTLFAFAPFLILVISIGGIIVSRDVVKVRVFTYFEHLFGVESLSYFNEMLTVVRHNANIVTLIALAIIFFGITTLFNYLQSSFATIFKVKDEDVSIVRRRLRIRAFSIFYAFILFLLILLLVIGNVVFAVLFDFFNAKINYSLSDTAFHTLNFLGTLVTITIFFASLYKFEARRLSWRNAWAGGLVAAFLFLTLNILLTLYLQWSIKVSMYGAGGFLVAILLWIYYASLALLLGAEISKVLYLFQKKKI